MITTQAESIRGTVMQAFESLTSSQIRELVHAPYAELRSELLMPLAA